MITFIYLNKTGVQIAPQFFIHFFRLMPPVRDPPTAPRITYCRQIRSIRQRLPNQVQVSE